MVQVAAAADSKAITIIGHGLTIPKLFWLTPDIKVEPTVPPLDKAAVQLGCPTAHDCFAVQSMHDIATFSLKVIEPAGGKALANKAWNALWYFHLLALCSGSPAFSLYSVSVGRTKQYAVANRNLIINPLPETKEVKLEQLEWAKANADRFMNLIKDAQFSSAMRYFGNSHYLFDHDARVMLLWAGIEGLLNVEAEQSRRIALYAALMFDGGPAEKADYAKYVKKAYELRSRVVHGSKPTSDKLEQGYREASLILARLLAKCTGLGRVPTRDELDALATSPSIARN